MPPHSPDPPHLVVRVTAKAHDGAANDAVHRAVAAALGLRRSEVTIVRGFRSRIKHLELDGDSSHVASALSRLPTEPGG